MAWILRNDRVLVALVAAIAAEAWYLTEPIVVTYDSFAYLSAAKFIAGVEGGSFAYWRPPLLPLLLAATGVPTHQTFFWFLQAQLALGIACVMLMHDCLRAVSRWFGLVATCVFVATFAPFVCSKSIMAEQIYLFAWCLCISSGLTYLWTGSAWRLAQVVVALLVLALSRAQGQYAIAAVLPVLAIGQPRRLPAIAVVLIAYASVVFCYGKLHTFIARSAAAPEKAIDVSSFGITDVTGKMLFYMVYPDIHPSVGQPAVSPENGPASRRMFEELKAYFSAPGHVPAMVAEARYRQFVGRPDDFIQSMQREPDPSYWYAIWYALDDRLGAAASDALLLRVALEAVAAHPFSMGLVYGRNFYRSFVRVGSPYVWQHPPFGPAWVGPGLGAEMEASGDPSVPTPLANVLNVVFPEVRLLLVLATIVVAPFAWFSRWRMGFVFCLVLVVYNQAMVAVLVNPESRHTFYIIAPLLATLTMGLTAGTERLRSRKGGCALPAPSPDPRRCGSR